MNPDMRAELEEQREFLLRSLDDLDREHAAGDLTDIDLHTLGHDYRRRLADVDQQLESGRRAAAAVKPAGPGRTIVTVVVVGALALSAGVAMASASGDRRAGDSLTGDIRESTTVRLEEAATLVQQDDFVEALRVYDEVLEDEPDNVEALAERGLLLVSLSQASDRPELAVQGRASVEQALVHEPDNPRALFYLGLALQLEGDTVAAEDAFDQALAADPPDALRDAIEEFRTTPAEAED